MKKTWPFSFILLSALLSISGCREETEVLLGSMVGFVNLRDDNGNILQDHSNVSIELEGTAYQSITNTNGRFSFPEIPVGTYNMLYEKEGFGTKKVYGVLITPGPKAVFSGSKLTLYKKPIYQVKEINIIKDVSALTFQFSTTPLEHYDLDVFISSSNAVDPIQWTDKVTFTYCCFSEPASYFEVSIENNNLSVDTSKIFYLIVYAKNPTETSRLDPENDAMIYSTWTRMSEIIAISEK